MNKWYSSTFVRYFISYFIVILVLLICFIFVIQSQLTSSYTNSLNKDVEQRLDIVQQQLSSEINSVMQINMLLESDILLLNYRYNSNVSNYQQLHKLMCNLVESNGFIESISYLDKKNGDFLSTKYIIKYKNDICDLYVGRYRYGDFNLRLAEEKENSTLFFLEGNGPICVLYIPSKIEKDYTIIYSLDLNALNQLLKDNMIPGMDALVMTNNEEVCFYGIHAEKMGTDSSSIPDTSGIYHWDEEYLMYVNTNVYEDYSLAALISKQFIAEQTHDAIRVAYLLLAGIGLLGLVLIFLSMRLTYFPLTKLFRKVVQNPKVAENYIDQMSTTFSDVFEEINQLQEKINKYHISIQKSLMNCGIGSDVNSGSGIIQNIEQLFRTDCENNVYILRISSERKVLVEESIQQILQDMLPEGSGFFTLESEEDYRVYVVNCVEQTLDWEEKLYTLLTSLHEETGCLCALSNRKSSLTDIPILYENSLIAAGYWPKMPVVFYSRIFRAQSILDDTTYPYSLLSLLNDSMDRLDFVESEVLLKRLLMQIDSWYRGDLRYPEFMIHCLLFDVLMSLFSAMSQHKVKYDIYKDLFYETLNYCRGNNWQEKKEEITGNLQKLFELFKLERNRIRAYQIQEYLEQKYASPELDVSSVADHFHVNSVYMSYVIKKELGENFVNYIWKLRLEKASDLLLHTDLPVDTISLLVGYENTSSFRRKFKKETGMTPTEFRNK